MCLQTNSDHHEPRSNYSIRCNCDDTDSGPDYRCEQSSLTGEDRPAGRARSSSPRWCALSFHALLEFYPY